MNTIDRINRLLNEHAAAGAGLDEAIAALRDLQVPDPCLPLRNAAASAVMRWQASGDSIHRLGAIHAVDCAACWLAGWDAAQNST